MSRSRHDERGGYEPRADGPPPTAPPGRSRHDELRALAGGYAVPEVPGHINVLACGVLALLDDLAAAEARAERAEAALREIEIWTRPDGPSPDRNVNAAARAVEGAPPEGTAP